MQKKNNNSLMIALEQLCFFALFFWYFVGHSFLRPSVNHSRESLIALMLVAVMIVIFWFLHPAIHSRNRNTYYVFCILVTTLAVFLEYILTINHILSKFPDEFLSVEEAGIKRSLILNLIFRDSIIVYFSGVLAENFGLKNKLIEKDKMILSENKIHVYSINGKESMLININEICYIRQKGNYNLLFTTDGKMFTRRGTLLEAERLLEEQGFIKVSKSTIVHLANIIGHSKNMLYFSEKGSKIEPIRIMATYTPTVVPIIKDYLKKKETEVIASAFEVTATHQSKDTNNSIISWVGLSETTGITTKSRKHRIICNYLLYHCDCKLNDIVSETHIPKSTVSRILAQLKQEGLIEYVGSKKTGGYRVCQKPMANPPANKQ